MPQSTETRARTDRGAAHGGFFCPSTRLGYHPGVALRAISGNTNPLPVRRVTPRLGVAIGRVGCFLTGLADHTHGVATSLPWWSAELTTPPSCWGLVLVDDGVLEATDRFQFDDDRVAGLHPYRRLAREPDA